MDINPTYIKKIAQKHYEKRIFFKDKKREEMVAEKKAEEIVELAISINQKLLEEKKQ